MGCDPSSRSRRGARRRDGCAGCAPRRRADSRGRADEVVIARRRGHPAPAALEERSVRARGVVVERRFPGRACGAARETTTSIRGPMTAYPDLETLIVERRGPVGRLINNRPETLYAMNAL